MVEMVVEWATVREWREVWRVCLCEMKRNEGKVRRHDRPKRERVRYLWNEWWGTSWVGGTHVSHKKIWRFFFLFFFFFFKAWCVTILLWLNPQVYLRLKGILLMMSFYIEVLLGLYIISLLLVLTLVLLLTSYPNICIVPHHLTRNLSIAFCVILNKRFIMVFSLNTLKFNTLQAFSDSDWAGYRDDRHSIGGFLRFFGDNLIS